MRNYPSKIILFGEYGVIKGADALITPIDKYNGQLEITNLDIDESLWNLFERIKSSRILNSVLDTRSLEKDLSLGLRFVSTISQGMGLGSSGALSAAIYDKYKKEVNDDLGLVQEYLALIESHFHGQSSGLDPLVSLLNETLFVKSGQEVETIKKPVLSHLGYFYVYNSQIQRHTAPLVHHFLKDYSNPNLKKEIDKYITHSNMCIRHILDLDKESFLDNYIEISKLQLTSFSHMIPDHIKKIWVEGLESGKYFMKLCGAGGGGYFQCYSTAPIDLDKTELIS